MNNAIRTSLAILAGSTAVAVGAAGVFSDVPDDHWARTAIEWSNQNRIMMGQGMIFRPNASLTRAEQAVVSMRLYLRIQEDLNVINARLNRLEAKVDLHEAAPRDNSSSSRSSFRSSTSFSVGDIPKVPVSFTARLYGSQEVPPVTTNGRGSATFRMTDAGLWYDVSVANLSGPITAAHFHMGEPGVSGPAVETITFTDGRAQGFWIDISAAQWTALKGGEMYINVHTEKYPDGEIRGKIEFVR